MIITAYKLCCGRCFKTLTGKYRDTFFQQDVEFEYFKTPEDARQLAIRQGWQIQADESGHLCPDCVKDLGIKLKKGGKQ